MIKPGRWIERISERLVDPRVGRLWRPLGWLLLLLLLLDLALGFYWSRQPALFPPESEHQEVPGVLTADTLMRVTETLFDKPGGYLSNDVLPHRLWLDNMPNWETGVLLQVRDLARVMGRDIGRAEQGRDEDLARAVSQFNFDPQSWAMPSTESEYLRGIKALQRYRDRLSDADQPARFEVSEEALESWLTEVQGRLDDLSLRLSQSVGRPVAGHADRELEVRTPRFQVDNIFYEARGTAWALYHLTLAVEQDFQPVIERRGAQASIRQAIRELEASTTSMRSPLILNGSGFGMFANHSLVMGNYLGRANAAFAEVRAALGK